MVVLGYDTTQPVTMEDMLHHCKVLPPPPPLLPQPQCQLHLQAVRRGAPSRFVVGDLPFGSYEVSVEAGLQNALRLVKEAGCDAVKLEGAGKYKLALVERLVDAGIAVMGHVGLTPQSIGVLGGFRAQGRTAVKARQIIDEALQLQAAGCFAVVIECVPAIVAKAITSALQVPTIGIGAGPAASGQVLVYHDLLGVMHHPHHAKHVPSFCKQYANLGEQIQSALLQYKHEVQAEAFPTAQYSPYNMSAEELAKFEALLAQDAEARASTSQQVDKKLREADEYEVVKLY